VVTEGEAFSPYWQGSKWGESTENVLIGEIKMDNPARLQLHTAGIAIFGAIQYRDTFGVLREMGFAFQPVGMFQSEYFKRWGDDEYNYDHRI
jgi:hypothetical protein